MMSTEPPAESSAPQSSNSRLFILVALLLVGVAYLLWTRYQAKQAAGLLKTRVLIAEGLAAHPYAGDDAVAAIIAEQVGSDVTPAVVNTAGDFIGDIVARQSWMAAKEQDWNAPEVAEPTLTKILQGFCPRRAEQSDVVCYPDDKGLRLVVSQATFDKMVDSGVAWHWLNKHVNSLDPTESAHLPELAPNAANELVDAMSYFALALFAAKVRAEKAGEEIDDEELMGLVERLLTSTLHAEEQAGEEGEAEGHEDPANAGSEESGEVAAEGGQ